MALKIFEYDPVAKTKREVEGRYRSNMLPRVDFPDHVVTVIAVDPNTGDTHISITPKDKA